MADTLHGTHGHDSGSAMGYEIARRSILCNVLELHGHGVGHETGFNALPYSRAHHVVRGLGPFLPPRDQKTLQPQNVSKSAPHPTSGFLYAAVWTSAFVAQLSL